MAVEKHSHIQIKGNINTLEIDELIKNAQVNILPTFQSTGIKLKLLAALFNGRHCMVNSPMVADTGLEELCTIRDEAEEIVKELPELFKKQFDMNEKQKREKVLRESFSNEANVKKLMELF
jgi:hypothetical protein